MLSGKTINNANTIIKEHVTSNSELSKYQSLTRQLIEAQDLPTPDRIKKSKEILLDLGLQDIVNISKLNTLTPDQIKEIGCLLYTSPSPRDRQKSRMPSSA